MSKFIQRASVMVAGLFLAAALVVAPFASARAYSLFAAGSFTSGSFSSGSLFDNFRDRFTSPQEQYNRILRGFCDRSVFEALLNRCATLPPVDSGDEGDDSDDDSGNDNGQDQPTETPPLADHIVINEVVSAPASGDPEWIELYNPTEQSFNLNGWALADNVGQHEIIAQDFVLGAGAFVIVATNSTNLESFGGTNFIGFSESIGNGLANNGDELHLLDETGSEIDAISYGSNANVFNPAAPAPGSGGDSISRVPNGADSDTSFEWEALDSPTPGQ